MIDTTTLGLQPAHSAGYGARLSPGWQVAMLFVGRFGENGAAVAGAT